VGGVWLGWNLEEVPLLSCTVISIQLLLSSAEQSAQCPICLNIYNESFLAAKPTSTTEQANNLVESYGHLIKSTLAIRNLNKVGYQHGYQFES
jgi:hypothetical protein